MFNFRFLVLGVLLVGVLVIPVNDVFGEKTASFLTEWGSLGSGDGQLNHPLGLTIDSSNNVYIGDFNNQRIQKFDPIFFRNR